MARILCLEPEIDIGKLVQFALKDHEVDLAANDEAAFKALNNGKKYELFMVEPVAGKTTINLIKLARAKDMSIVYLTNLSPSELGNYSVAHVYIPKPFDPLYLKDQVDNLTQKK